MRPAKVKKKAGVKRKKIKQQEDATPKRKKIKLSQVVEEAFERSSPRLSRRLHRQVVILRTGTIDEKKDKKLRSLGATILSEFDQKVTHIVSDQARRTFKFLVGMAHADYIVTEKWVDKCITAGHLGVAESKDFPAGKDARKVEEDYAFELKRSFDLCKEQKVFRRFKFYLSKKITGKQKDCFVSMVRAHGGTVITKLPRSAGKINIYLGHPNDTKTEIKKMKKKGFPVVPQKEIATIILRQFINLAEYKR